MKRLTKDDMFAELAIRDMLPIDMQQLAAIYHTLRLYEKTGITPDEFEIINQEYTRMAREISILRGRNRWIPAAERLPEEPENGMVDIEDLTEYIVTIDGADAATVLRYAGYGDWYDDEAREFYRVIAWMPLPEPYKESGGNDGK